MWKDTSVSMQFTNEVRDATTVRANSLVPRGYVKFIIESICYPLLTFKTTELASISLLSTFEDGECTARLFQVPSGRIIETGR
jgi:hypothetical protein